MGYPSLLWGTEALQVHRVQIAPEAVTVTLAARTPSCPCPFCGMMGRRIHSHYTRTLHDLPASGRPIRLRVETRRFFCDWRPCPRETFSEQLPELTARHARKTCRLTESLRELAFATGGEVGSRLAGRLAMAVSPDTLLRLARYAPPVVHSARVLGVDDWAFHRGQRYGTILCDLEAQRPIDLLPERSSVVFADWLRLHPGTQVISRDRGMEYAKGATIGAPGAAQVADRFHLRRNLTDSLIQALDRRHTLIAEAAKPSVEGKTQMSPSVDATPVWSASACLTGTPMPLADKPEQPGPTVDSAEETARTTRKQQRQEERRAKRLARYEEIKRLEADGLSLRQIVRRLRLSRCTVRRWVRVERFPERASRPKPRQPLDEFTDYLRRRWEQGCHSAARLYRELQMQGFGGSLYMVRRRVVAWRQPEAAGHTTGPRPTSKPASVWRPSARNVAWLLLKPEKDRSAEQEVFLAALHQRWPELSENVALVQEFGRVLSGRDPADLEAWVELTHEPAVVPELKRFAEGLKQDWAAVVEAVRQSWSNGQVEGQVNRLKLIKRQMYGRANFDLLRARVLHVG